LVFRRILAKVLWFAATTD